ncbi:TetR/AcrR family transcriptional regulator [Mycolicibacter hiberniae]|uniref:TetR family transcriptional regulator n=1 Tax=Mycolicibacter hiberniae TaxID=29314 RepID=A0A7I7WZR4_9MYCO|nr:TetR/AcrR family transcriptional regulator [Mycolicibacter hiberniae]MCV7086461.1 TetR/AcrR family transcriptional regulator [Mycolicibacter hiberniae]ORV70022.1 TetR family transcriptional regulator [Mycolicibacter hiberniae]BBZ22033.1 TetR family transcriptional regulator [Mycolicibacter hiberniae]
MTSAKAVKRTRTPAGGVRETRRLETRARLFEAAVAEISRFGLAGADVSAIAHAAGVARGTFYFHFPTKEHVLLELRRNEESRIVDELRTAQTGCNELTAVLSLVADRVLDAEQRLGEVIFRDMLGMQFSTTRPTDDQLTEHPLVGFVTATIAAAQAAGSVPAQADTTELGVFFLTGLFALLATGAHDSPTADALFRRYVTTIVKGMEKR